MLLRNLKILFRTDYFAGISRYKPPTKTGSRSREPSETWHPNSVQLPRTDGAMWQLF